jgi:hypothetical protein
LIRLDILEVEGCKNEWWSGLRERRYSACKLHPRMRLDDLKESAPRITHARSSCVPRCGRPCNPRAESVKKKGFRV